jgi:sugar lactone lactonase YvrE
MPDNRFDFLEFDDPRPARPKTSLRPQPPLAQAPEATGQAAATNAADGEWRVVELIGSAGHAAGEFSTPAGLATDLAENLYVADAYNHRVQRISRDGLVTVFGARGLRPGQFHMPRAIDVDAEYRMFVLETGSHRVQVMDADGISLRTLGAAGHGLAEFHNPTDLCLGPYGTLLVADAGNRRVSRWRRLGEPLDIVSTLPGGVSFRQP